MQEYKTILIDPPWPVNMTGRRKRYKGGQPESLPYETMSLIDIMSLPVRFLGSEDSHLWLWTTNQFLESGFLLLRAWGYKYLSCIHVIKPSGVGNYFIQRSQTLLFAYKEKCKFPKDRYKPNIINVSDPARHSEKWDETYTYIEGISPAPRLEMFARRKRNGWDVWGNEVESDINIETYNNQIQWTQTAAPAEMRR
jgi:N6-adenosine-specific RNA methylase IME4